MNIVFVTIIISLLTGVISYFSSGNLYVAIGVAAVFAVYFTFYVRKKIQKHSYLNKSAHECNNFINTFLLSMSIRNSMNEAYENATMNIVGAFKHEVAHLEQLSVRERIHNLSKYFQFDIYHMFLNVLSLYEEQGGNILLMGEALMKEANRIEQAMITVSSLNIRKIFEFTILWVITMGIVVFMRFGLASFYSQMLNGVLLIAMTIMLFGLFLFSIHMAMLRLTNKTLNGENHHASL